MRLALGIFMLWVGVALIWVAFHGLDGETASPGAIWATLGKQLRKEVGDGDS